MAETYTARELHTFIGLRHSFTSPTANKNRNINALTILICELLTYFVSRQRLNGLSQDTMKKPDNMDNSATHRGVYFVITLGVALSMMLILVGIYNARQTGVIADTNIQTSLKIQQLSDSLRIHQESMSSAIEFAVTSGEAHWRNNYENSLLKLQDVMHTSSLAVTHTIVDEILQQNQRVIAQERQLFKLVAAGKRDDAFALLASDEYQEIKIVQEQQALTLRATLNRKAKENIEQFNTKLNKTTLVLSVQIFLISGIWIYVMYVLRKWHKQQDAHSDQLTRLAHFDTLTGIGNRALFQIRLEAAFQQSRRNNTPVGLLLMDIDHFKDINDSLGHDVGDELLIRVATELKRACRESDTVIRLGGDEFAIIVNNFEQKRDTAVLGNKILSIFQQPLLLKKREIKTGTSIGLAFYPDDAATAEELLRKADMALYEAKRNGRANFKYFDRNIEIAARKKVAMQADIAEALEQDQFELHYQPLIDLASNSVIGVESLIRWNHPKQGFIPPDDFISIAEESRQVVAIGTWVLRQACEQQTRWEQRGLPSLSIAVNLSGVQFDEPDLIETVESIMRETRIQHDRLTLEITESTLMETNGDVVAKLHALNSLGLKLAIDDFGTGYSSLAYLKRFPIHHLKIDRAFVKDLPHDSHDIAIARSIIKMAHELQINVVAEGIEELAQFNFLKKAECNYGQGYYFGKPMPAKDFEEWLLHAQNSYGNIRHLK
jgi:diguanylate cyclase (GGDEF)-like protein